MFSPVSLHLHQAPCCCHMLGEALKGIQCCMELATASSDMPQGCYFQVRVQEKHHEAL